MSAPALAATPTDTASVQSSGTHGSLAGALAAFQLTVPEVTKGNDAKVQSDKGSYTYSYADLADVTRTVLPLLAANGLSWTCAPTMQGGAFVLHYRLMHDSGEVLEGFYPLGAPGGKAQATGSAITYGRRYCLLAVTGVCPDDEDDDGHAASQNQQRGGPQRPPTPPQRRQQPTAENRGAQAAAYILGAPDPTVARKRAAWLEENGLVDHPAPALPDADRQRFRLDESARTLGDLATAVIDRLDDEVQTALLEQD